MPVKKDVSVIQKNEFYFSLLEGVLLVTVLPLVFVPSFLTNILAMTGIVVFIVGLIYGILVGRCLFLYAWKNWPKTCYYLSSLGWIPVVFSLATLMFFAGKRFFPLIVENFQIIDFIELLFWGCLVLCGVSLYLAWHNRKKNKKLCYFIQQNKIIENLKKQVPLPKRILKGICILSSVGISLFAFFYSVVCRFLCDRSPHSMFRSRACLGLR